MKKPNKTFIRVIAFVCALAMLLGVLFSIISGFQTAF